MPSIDDFKETPKYPGSREALEWRQRERLAGRLNAPIRGTHGLAALVAERCGRKLHPLMCRCSWCNPPDMPLFSPCGSMPAQEPAVKPKVFAKKLPKPGKSKRGFRQPVRKWSEQRGSSSN